MRVLLLSFYALLQLVAFVDSLDLFTITSAISQPFDNFPAAKFMFSEFGLVSTFSHTNAPDESTTAKLAEFNCTGAPNPKSRLFGLSCTMIHDQTIYMACGETSIDRIYEVDPNGLPISNVKTPIPSAFAMAAEHVRIYTVDRLGDQLLRLSSWSIRNMSDVDSCVFSMPRPLEFLSDQLDQMPMVVLGEDSFHLIGRVKHRSDLELISLDREVVAGTACEGTQTPITFNGFDDVPFPVQGISWNSQSNSILLPVVLDWSVTKLAQIDPVTSVATAVPGFDILLPDTVYAGGYSADSDTYTVVTTKRWPTWSYQTFDFQALAFTGGNDIEMADSQFWALAACVY